MDIKYFEKFDITAGLTLAPDLSDVRRSAMAEEASFRGGCVIRPCLVHGIHIEQITPEFLEDSPFYIEIEECDGLVTDIPDVTLTSTHGDCIPVYAYDPDKRVIGLAHAGWRGTVDGIAAELIASMKNNYDCDPASIYAVVGPGIGRCHFEVSEDVAMEFREKLSWADQFIDDGPAPGKYMIDLKGINALFLENAGVKNIEISPVCTFEDENCYSYRRDGTQKRMLAYIRL